MTSPLQRDDVIRLAKQINSDESFRKLDLTPLERKILKAALSNGEFKGKYNNSEGMASLKEKLEKGATITTITTTTKEKKSSIQDIRNFMNGLTLTQLYKKVTKAETPPDVTVKDSPSSRPSKPIKSFEDNKLAADKGNASAQYDVGYCYENGIDVVKDLNKAVKYYKMSANRGNASAQNNLGCCYLEGEGVARDLNKAIKYYKMSADRGNAQAQFNLGCCYEDGEGVKQDLNEAVKYYELAAKQGDADAIKQLKRLKKT